MQVQTNTDRNIEGNEALTALVSGVGRRPRRSDRITRGVSDENADKSGQHDALHDGSAPRRLQ
jgi:hypothetical protein